MAQVKYQVVARVGEYEKNGETKPRWQNVGVVMQTDKGHILLLEPWFNPAGIPRDGDKVLLSLFEPQEREQSGQQGGQAPSQPQGGQPPSDDFDDDIPW